MCSAVAVANEHFHTHLLIEVVHQVDGHLVPVAVEATAACTTIAVPAVDTVGDTIAGYTIEKGVGYLLPVSTVLPAYADDKRGIAGGLVGRSLHHDGVIDKHQRVLNAYIHSIVQCFSFSLGTAVAQTDGFVDGGVVRGRAVGEVIGDQRVFAKL